MLVVTLVGCGGSDRPPDAGSAAARTQLAADPSTVEMPPVKTDVHGCGAGSTWRTTARTCRLDPVGPATGQRGSGELRFVRAPLVELFAPRESDVRKIPSFWVFLRLNRQPHGLVITAINRTEPDLTNDLGYDQRIGSCIGTSFDLLPSHIDPSLRQVRAGQRVTVSIRYGHGKVLSAPTRVRAMLPKDTPDAGTAAWYRALGCSPGSRAYPSSTETR
jgi:hypothetical protein